LKELEKQTGQLQSRNAELEKQIENLKAKCVVLISMLRRGEAAEK
jgi:cell division protein FtsB